MSTTRTNTLWTLGLSLVACLALSACGDSATDTGFFINVGIQNSTNVGLSVEIEPPSGSVTFLALPGYSSTEVSGTSGEVVNFRVFQSSNMLGEGACTSTNAIVGTAQYGQVNLYYEQPSGVFMVECSSGWLGTP